MNQGQPPWHSCRLQLAQTLQTLQSANKPLRQEGSDSTRQHDDVVHLVQSRIAAVRSALLSKPARVALDDASHKADESAATPRFARTGTSCLDETADGDTDAGGRWEDKAAGAGAAQRMFHDAVAAHEQLDFAAAMPLFKLAGEAGHGASCAYLALYLIEGRGCTRDVHKAWAHACKGAELKDADSMGLKAR